MFRVAIALLLLGVSAADDQCLNPVFDASGSGSWGKMSWSGSIKIASEPQVFPQNAKVCTKFAGQKSCCDANALTAIGEANAAAQAAIKAAEDVWDDMSFDVVANGLRTACAFTSDKTACDYKVTDAVNSFKKALDGVVAANINCEKGVTAYSLGMMCFACKPNPLQYIDTKAKVLKIAQHTCDAVYDSCSGTFDAYKNMIQAQISLVEAIINSFSIVKININFDVNLCGKQDCKKFVCNDMISGLFSTIPQAPSNPWGPASRRLMEMAAEQAADGGLEQEHIDRIMGHLEALHRTLPESVTGDKRRALATKQQGSGNDNNRRQLGYASSALNNYVSEGYDPYEVGCKDTPGCGGMGVGAIAAIACGSLILLVGVAFVIHRRRQASGSGGVPAAAAGATNYGAFK